MYKHNMSFVSIENIYSHTSELYGLVQLWPHPQEISNLFILHLSGFTVYISYFPHGRSHDPVCVMVKCKVEKALVMSEMNQESCRLNEIGERESREWLVVLGAVEFCGGRHWWRSEAEDWRAQLKPRSHYIDRLKPSQQKALLKIICFPKKNISGNIST